MFEISGIGIFTVFAAGLISFLSPCVLPLVPGYLSFIAGESVSENNEEPGWRSTTKARYLSWLFVSGFSIVFILLGASASAVGQLLLSYRYEANIVGGLVIIAFGIFMTGLVKLPWLQRELRYHGEIKGARPITALGLGLAFAFGWTPCIGPILGAILTLSASSALISNGTALLAFYSLGLGVPFVLAALFTDRFMHHSNYLKKHGKTLHIITGGLLVLMGVAMITGYLTDFSIWILKTFPWLGQLG